MMVDIEPVAAKERVGVRDTALNVRPAGFDQPAGNAVGTKLCTI